MLSLSVWSRIGQGFEPTSRWFLQIRSRWRQRRNQRWPAGRFLDRWMFPSTETDKTTSSVVKEDLMAGDQERERERERESLQRLEREGDRSIYRGRQESPPHERCSTPSCDPGESSCNNEKQTIHYSSLLTVSRLVTANRQTKLRSDRQTKLTKRVSSYDRL